jgi:hypothetical protein
MSTMSDITRADDLSVHISRPDSPGMSNYRDDEDFKKRLPKEF